MGTTLWFMNHWKYPPKTFMHWNNLHDLTKTIATLVHDELRSLKLWEGLQKVNSLTSSPARSNEELHWSIFYKFCAISRKSDTSVKMKDEVVKTVFALCRSDENPKLQQSGCNPLITWYFMSAFSYMAYFLP